MIRWSELDMVDIGNGVDFELRQPLTFWLNEVEKITVPKLFVTDLASVPQIFWTVYPKHGKYTRAAVMHDFIYSGAFLPRKLCDELFLQAMYTLGVPWWQAYSMYTAVRVFGGFAQAQDTCRSIAKVRSLSTPPYYTGDLNNVDPCTIKRPLLGYNDKIII